MRVGVAYLHWTDTDMVRGADATPGLGELRAQLPGVLGRTYPLAPAVVRLADGIARRRSSVYGQGWLRALPPLRGLLPLVTTRPPRRRLLDVERRLVAGGPVATAAVGAGGRAGAPPGAPSRDPDHSDIDSDT